MRKFVSYGPVNLQHHFGVPRTELVQQCVSHLVGNPIELGGHYFTVWAPRQTGKTWVIQQAMEEVRRQYGDQFAICSITFEAFNEIQDPPPDPTTMDFPDDFVTLLSNVLPTDQHVRTWSQFLSLFMKETQVWDRPVLLLIDEVDSMPSSILDYLMKKFRTFYLHRHHHWVHGLALIGIRAVMGIESKRGSPFNVQRSLYIPNLTADEVREMYQQYQAESRQTIETDVVEEVYAKTLGQPGLVSWFGELLTQRYNPTPPYPLLPQFTESRQPITEKEWRIVRMKARRKEPNNFILNVQAKAYDPEHRAFLATLFRHSDLPFAFHNPLHNYLYMHGIISSEMVEYPEEEPIEICRFSSPFVQECLYHALIEQWDSNAIPSDVISMSSRSEVVREDYLYVPFLLARYQSFLAMLAAQDMAPWKDQPRRKSDYHLIEAVGHFHLYAWLQQAIGHWCRVTPEFPTGNGQVDLVVRCDGRIGVIEVKSFVSSYRLNDSRIQAARYAQQMEVAHVTVAVFIEIQDEVVVTELSGVEMIEGIEVTTIMIRWGW